MNNAGGVDILILITTHQLQLTLYRRCNSAERNMLLHVVKAIHVFCLNFQFRYSVGMKLSTCTFPLIPMIKDVTIGNNEYLE